MKQIGDRIKVNCGSLVTLFNGVYVEQYTEYAHRVRIPRLGHTPRY